MTEPYYAAMTDTELTDTERGILLTPCECGHTINDHGSTGHCWLCLDDGRPDCAHDFEDLLAVRVARIVAARVAAARADERERITRIPDSEPTGWTAEQWRANASYWHEQAQEAYRFRDMAIAAADTLRAAVAVPEPEPTEGDTP